MTRRPFLAFLVAASAFSWPDWLSLAAGHARVAPGRLPTDMVGMAGTGHGRVRRDRRGGRRGGAPGPGAPAGAHPLAVGLVLDLWRRVRSGSRSARWRCWRWPAQPVPSLDSFARYPGIPALPLVMVFDLVLLGVGFGQEIGWRGLALPRMQARFGPLGGAVLLALPWGAWMLPLLAVYRAGLPPGASPLLPLAIGAILLVASSVVLAFVVARTEGSLVAADTLFLYRLGKEHYSC